MSASFSLPCTYFPLDEIPYGPPSFLILFRCLLLWLDSSKWLVFQLLSLSSVPQSLLPCLSSEIFHLSPSPAPVLGGLVFVFPLLFVTLFLQHLSMLSVHLCGVILNSLPFVSGDSFFSFFTVKLWLLGHVSLFLHGPYNGLVFPNDFRERPLLEGWLDVVAWMKTAFIAP